MNPATSRWSKLLAPPLAGALLLAACSSDDSDGAAGAPADGGGLTGTVVVTGSSTVEPISIAVAEKYGRARCQAAKGMTSTS